MAIYSLGLPTTVTTTGAAAMDLKASAANSPRVMEVGLNLQTATASTYGLGRASNVPTQTAPVLVQAENPADPAGLSGLAVAWSPTAPTIPSQFLRRISLPATAGAGVIWTFPRGIGIPINGSIVLWVIATASVVDCYAVADE